MYRILIVDDEPYITDWVCNIVESIQEVELDVYRAYSAEEALNFFRRAKIDILVSDICMTGTNGIDLLIDVKKHWPECKVIMLTAYTDFDYAYKSLRNNAFAYILKNEKDENILETIKRAIDEIEDELTNSQIVAEAEKKVNETRTILREEFLLGLLEGNSYSHEVLSDKYKKLDIAFITSLPYILFVGKLKVFKSKMDTVDNKLNITPVKHLIEQNFKSKFNVQCVQYNDIKLFCILQYRWNCEQSKTSELQSAHITGTLETIQKICRNNFGLELSIVYANSYLSIEGLPDKFNALDNIISTTHLQENGFILNEKSNAGNINVCGELSNDSIKELSSNDNFFERLKFSLETGQREIFFEYINIVGQKLGDVDNKHDKDAMQIYYRIALILLSYINKRKLTEEVTSKIALNRLMREDIHKEWDNAVDYLKKLSELLFNMNESNDGSTNLIEFIQKYIEKNFAKDVSLVKLSEVTGYNPSYISRMYKEVEGQTLSDYISTVRLNKVKELMVQENISLNDITISVGFQSRQYFNRFIKKMTNMTPNEFQQHLNNKSYGTK